MPTSMIRIYTLTPAEFASKQAMLVAQGQMANGKTGTLSDDGVTVAYSYDGARYLTVTLVKKPGYIPVDFVERKMDSWLGEIGVAG